MSAKFNIVVVNPAKPQIVALVGVSHDEGIGAVSRHTEEVIETTGISQQLKNYRKCVRAIVSRALDIKLKHSRYHLVGLD